MFPQRISCCHDGLPLAFASAGAPGSMLGEGTGATGDAGDCSVGVATDAGETGAEDTASTKPGVGRGWRTVSHGFFWGA